MQYEDFREKKKIIKEAGKSGYEDPEGIFHILC